MTETDDRATSSATDIVERLAEALDRDDFVAAASVMADQIEYTIGEQEMSGPEAVIASYRDASRMAHRFFDRVEYGHHVVPTTPASSGSATRKY